MTTKPQERRADPQTPAGRPVDPLVLKAIAHPLRHRVLSRLNEGVASPKRLSDEFGMPLKRVSYHVGILRDLGCIELVDTAKRRGATEHFYRAILRPTLSDEEWATVPPSTQHRIVDQHLRRVIKDVTKAADAGGFGSEHAHLSWMPLDLDVEGLAATSQLLGATLDRLLEIHAESAGRQIERGAGEAPPFRTEVAMLHFDRVGSGSSKAGGKKRKKKDKKKKGRKAKV